MEGVARDEWMTAYVNIHDNKTNIFTKVLLMSEKQQHRMFGSFPEATVVA